MGGRRWVIGACAMLAGCNLLSGAADLVAGPDDGTPGGAGIDGSLGPDGATGGTDGSVDAKDGAVRPMLDGSAALDAGVPRPDGGRLVFVTSVETNGALSGVAGADTQCASLAASAGLGGAWTAWVSSVASTAPSRLTSAGPWYLVDGTLVATSKAELAGFGMIEHAIDRDEQGATHTNSAVWTGGAFGYANCNDWSSLAPGAVGTTGSTQLSGPGWQEMSTAACSSTHSLYCFEN